MTHDYTKYFTNPELSQKLERLNFVTQFPDALYCYSNKEYTSGLEIRLSKSDHEVCSEELHVKTYHWSDLCIPENAKKLWPGDNETPRKFIILDHWQLMSRELCTMVQSGRNWQKYLSDLIDTF